MAKPSRDAAIDYAHSHNLSAGLFERASCPPEKSFVRLKDAQNPNLHLRITQAGGKHWQFEARVKGSLFSRSLGQWPALSIGEAQKIAAQLRALTTQGIDPRDLDRKATEEAQALEQAKDLARTAQQQKEEREALTFGQAWAHYMAERRPYWGARNYADHAAMIQRGGQRRKRGQGLTVAAPLAVFVPMRLIDINAEAVEQWAAKEGQERGTRARLAKRLLGAFFNWCKEQPAYAAIVPEQNPATTRRTAEALGKAEAKQDALLKEQLPAWFDAVGKLRNTTAAAYLQCLLLTGARPNELMQLRWDDVNTQWRGLSLRDKDESKGGRDGRRIIPLTPYVQHLIERLPKRSAWVFGSDLLSQPISRPTRLLTDVCTVAGIEHLTLHGLRRSFGSLAEWLDLPAGVVAQIQGHKPSATAEKHYRVRELGLLRQHHERLEGWILEQAGVPFDPEAGGGKLKLIKSA